MRSPSPQLELERRIDESWSGGEEGVVEKREVGGGTT